MQSTVALLVLISTVCSCLMTSSSSDVPPKEVSKSGAATTNHRRHSLGGATNHHKLKPMIYITKRDAPTIYAAISNKGTHDDNHDVTHDDNHDDQSASSENKDNVVHGHSHIRTARSEDNIVNRDRRSLGDMRASFYEEEPTENGHEINNDKMASKRGFKSLGFRSDLGKRRTGGDGISSDDDDNAGGNTKEEEEEKRARSGFRGDLGKRAASRGYSGFRGDLGKRPLSSRASRGLRGESGRSRYSFGTSGFRGDLGKRVSWVLGSKYHGEGDSSEVRGNEMRFEKNDTHSNELANSDISQVMSNRAPEPNSAYDILI